MSPLPRIVALATAVPPHVLPQEHVRRQIPQIFGDPPPELARLLPIYANAGVATRYSCVPADWFESDHGWSDRNPLYIEHSLALLERAAASVCERGGIKTTDIDTVVCVSTTGIATPSLDALLVDRLPLRSDVRRLPIFGLGCGGGVIGLARAGDMAAACPGEQVLFLVVEPCALTFRRSDRSAGNIVASALFGDGAAAALITTASRGPAIVASGEHTWPGTRQVMGWGVEDDGLRVVFSREIPRLVEERFRDAVDAFLARQRLTLADIDTFICHPGGARVLDALQAALGLTAAQLDHSRSILRDYGNMSAVTVLFVLERALEAGDLNRRSLMTTLGPGFTAAFLVLEAGDSA